MQITNLTNYEKNKILYNLIFSFSLKFVLISLNPTRFF